VRLRFASRDWIGKSRSATPPRGAALLAIFAILLQAALFAWHHHPFPLSSRDAPTVLVPAGPSTPVLMDDDCQICFALSHHSAAPVDFVAPPTPVCGSSPLTAVEAVLAPVAAFLLFRSRAPPRA
jgi:hypothetical protein